MPNKNINKYLICNYILFIERFVKILVYTHLRWNKFIIQFRCIETKITGNIIGYKIYVFSEKKNFLMNLEVIAHSY